MGKPAGESKPATTLDSDPTHCPECGTVLSADTTCREHFHALLFLEAEAPDAGLLAHFYAVATYVLQHPASMGYTVAAIAGLRTAVADALTGKADTAGLRRRHSALAGGPARITRRQDEPIPKWPASNWPMIVTDIIAGGADEYATNVEKWARVTLDTLDSFAP
ncbi:MAG: DUF5946 family protein [Litorilinea sp.]